MSKRPTVEDTLSLFEGFFHLKKDTLKNHAGEVSEYVSLILSSDATAILTRTLEGLWVLNYEYRHPVQSHLLGCPGGRLEPNEEPIEGAKRELFEETGYISPKWTFLGSCYTNPSLSNQKIYYFLAEDAIRNGEQKLDPFEYIEIHLLSKEELSSLLKESSQIDSVLCTALCYAMRNKDLF